MVSGCANETGGIQTDIYYFPLDELREGKVYEYRTVGNPNDPPMYWYYKSLQEEDREYLIGMGYDPDFAPDQFVREERLQNGMKLVDFYTYEADSTGKRRKLQAVIEAGNVFPFRVKDPPGVLLTSIHWQTLSDRARIHLVRNRQYEKDTLITFRGKSVDAVKFNTIELIEHEQEGRLPLEYTGEEIYAKGIGLVFLQKNISEEWQMKYQLVDRYEMEEFEARFKRQLEGQ